MSEWEVIEGDCVNVLAGMAPESVDAIVTDPPYGLEFMGHEWDRQDQMQEWHHTWAIEAMRVVKPGGHVLVFGAPRTYHRMVCGIEDAGFEVRDSLLWLFGSGFPKSLDVGRILRADADMEARRWFTLGHGTPASDQRRELVEARVTELAEAVDEWEGWGTALKPGYEPIVVARKPLAGTVVENVLEHRVGALHIEACRIGFKSAEDEREAKEKNRHGDFGTEHGLNTIYGDYTRDELRTNYDPPGRWPSNLLLSHTEDCQLVGVQTVASDGHFPAARGPSGYGSNGANVAESRGGG